MTDEEIRAALAASGECDHCEGSGCEPGTSDSRGRTDPCGECGRTGNDPLALLRAVQAVVQLLLNASGERAAGRAKFKIRPADEVDKDLVWHCATCGDHGPAEPPYELGDKEKCTRCGDAWSVVMALKDATKIECEVARRLRSGQGGSAAVGAAPDATKEDGQ